MEDDIDYSELNDIEVGCAIELLDRRDEDDNYFFHESERMTWYDIQELADKGDEQAIALVQARNILIRSKRYGRTNS